MTTVCPRCTGKDGAHFMECVIGRLFERLMGPDYPWKAPLAPVPDRSHYPETLQEYYREQEALRVRQTAEEPAPEPEPKPDYVGEIVSAHAEAAVPTPQPVEEVDIPALVQAVRDRHGWSGEELANAVGASASAISYWMRGSKPRPFTVARLQELLEAEPVKPRLAPAAPKPKPVADPTGANLPRRASAESMAAIELFIEEMIEDGDPQDAVNVGAMSDAYNQWRTNVDAPAIPVNLFSDALDRMDVVKRRMTEAERIKLGRPNAPMLVLGKRIKGEEPIRLPKGLDADIDWPTARRAMIAAFAQDCLILGESGPTDIPFSQRSDWTVGTRLTDAYEEWRAENQPEWPTLGQSDVTRAMGSLGYTARQSIIIGGSKPTMFFGVVVRPKANWGQPRASERHADADQEDHSGTAAIRAAMKAVKRAARSAPEPAPQPAEPAPEVESPSSPASNNGWHKAPTTGGDVEVPVLTLEDLEAENAQVMAAKRRGPSTAGLRRPKQGEITNKDVRRLVNMAVDQGYIYWLDGSNHPKVQHPTDPTKRIGCAGSASDRNAHKQVARDLKRIGVKL